MTCFSRREMLIGAGTVGCIILTQTSRAKAAVEVAKGTSFDFVFEHRMTSSADLVRIAKDAGHAAYRCGNDVGTLAMAFQRRWSTDHGVLIGCTGPTPRRASSPWRTCGRS